MRHPVLAILCLSCVYPAGGTKGSGGDSTGETDADADSDSDGDGDSGSPSTVDNQPTGAPIVGDWAGLCDPSGTGTTSTTIQDLAISFELRENAGAVEGNGTLTLYSYHSPDTSDSGAPAGTVTNGSPIFVTGTWDGATVTLGFGQSDYTDVYMLPMRLVATLDGDGMEGMLTFYPDGSEAYATATWACAFHRS